MSQSAAEKLLADVAERFKAKLRHGKLRAHCPSHSDRRPSLCGEVGRHRDRVVIHCFAGCDVETVLRAVGLCTQDLFVKRPGRRPESALGVARVFRPEKRQWRLDVLASKLPAIAGVVLADADVQRLFPTSSGKTRARAIRRLARELGVVTSKVGMRGGWLWTLELARNHEGDTAAAASPAKGQLTVEGDALSGWEALQDGQNRPFAPSPKDQERTEGDIHPRVRYEERSPSVGTTGGLKGVGVAPTLTEAAPQRLLDDSEAQKAVADLVELFDGCVVKVRAWDAELDSWWTQRRFSREEFELRVVDVPAGKGCEGCSRCGDSRTVGLYARVRPDFWLCSRCFRARGCPVKRVRVSPSRKLLKAVPLWAPHTSAARR